MKTINTETSRAARISGVTYVAVILLGVCSVNIIKSHLISPDNISDTIQNIKANETLFRTGIISELVMYVLVIVLSISLYVLLKNIDHNLV
jgi:hypothetical protein